MILDQRSLPLREEYLICKNADDIAEAIRQLAVRGAPAIGIAAAMALALAAKKSSAEDVPSLKKELRTVAEHLIQTRPTAVNLIWALDRMMRCCDDASLGTVSSLQQKLVQEALHIQEEDVRNNRALSFFGQELLPDSGTVMTICNTGSLATGGYGTALGVVRAATEKGKRIHVVACETRPLLQGARLTAWELSRDRIPYTIITEGAAAWYMTIKGVDIVLAGADRIAANGDTANKIGTYGLAVLAHKHDIPFIIAAPCATFDTAIECAAQIPIEERSPDEILTFAGIRIAPPDARVWNPAFDIVPHDYIHAFITEKGILRPPFAESICAICT